MTEKGTEQQRKYAKTGRGLDVVLAVAAILVLWPVMLTLAVAVRIDSRGPAVYREERLGRSGKPFSILKFRTLHPQSGDASPLAPSDDSRVTRLGAWLRPVHLDELPQLFNILRGEMRIVGPRPTKSELWDGVDEDLRRRALAFAPGLTSPATLRFNCEDDVLAEIGDPVTAYRDLLFPAKVALDVEYFEHRRHGNVLGSDLKIILATTGLVLGKRDERACRRRIARLLAKTDSRNQSCLQDPATGADANSGSS